MATLGSVSYNLQLNGVRKFVGGAQAASKSTASLNKALLGLTAAATGVALGLNKLAGAAGEFEEGLAAVGAVTKASTEDLKLLKDAAIQAGVATQFSPKAAVDGLLALSTAGQTATQAAKTLIPVLDLAAGSLGQLTTEQAGMAIVGTMNTYGIAVDKAAGVTDKLLRITQLTNFQTKDFEAGLAKAAAKSNVFGQSLDDTLVVMGLLRNANIDASSAATAYTSAIARLATDQKALNTMNKLGVSIYDKQTGATRGFMDLVTDLKPKLDQLTDSQRNKSLKDMFGARAIAAYNSVAQAQVTVIRDGEQITLKGAAAIEHLREQIGSATGVSKEFTDALLDTFAGQKKLLAGSLETLTIVSGEEFANAFRPFVSRSITFINELLDTVRNMSSESKREFAETVISGLKLAAAFAAILASAKILIPVIGGLTKAYMAMRAAIAAVQAQGFVGALSTMATRMGPVATGLFKIGKAFATVKVGAVAAGAALVIAANKSYNALKRARDDAKLMEKIRSGQATDEDYGAIRIGQESKGQVSLRTRDRSTGKVTGGRQVNLSSKPIDVASASYNQLASQLAKLTDLQEEMIRINDSGMRASLQGVAVENGRVTKAYRISMEELERRIQVVRKAHDAMILAEADMAAATEVIRQPQIDTALNAASTSAPSASGWTEEEMRAQSARRQYEQELADIRRRRLEERLAREKAFLKQMDAEREKSVASMTSGTTDSNRSYLEAQLRADRTLGMGPQEAAKLQKKEADKAAARANQIQSQRVGAALGAVQAGASGNLGGAVTSSFAAAGAALGPLVSGGLALFDTFAGMSEEGQAFKEQIGSIFTRLGTILAPVFSALGQVVSVIIDSLEPTFQILAITAKAVSVVVSGVVIVFREMAMAVLSIIDFFTMGLLGLEDNITELGEANDATKKKMMEQLNGVDAQTEATRKQTEATQKATEALTNVPAGVKVATERFRAAQVGVGRTQQFNDFVQRPGQAATNFSPDDTIIGVKDLSALGGGGSTIILQNVHINADNPTAFFRNLLDLVNRDHKRGGQALGGMFQGRP